MITGHLATHDALGILFKSVPCGSRPCLVLNIKPANRPPARAEVQRTGVVF